MTRISKTEFLDKIIRETLNEMSNENVKLRNRLVEQEAIIEILKDDITQLIKENNDLSDDNLMKDEAIKKYLEDQLE